MFFRSLVVPQTPPSFVKFSASALDVMTGSRNSVPSSDHVPELRKAVLPDADTDATADAVSWQAGATTGVPSKTQAFVELANHDLKPRERLIRSIYDFPKESTRALGFIEAFVVERVAAAV